MGGAFLVAVTAFTPTGESEKNQPPAALFTTKNAFPARLFPTKLTIIRPQQPPKPVNPHI